MKVKVWLALEPAPENWDVATRKILEKVDDIKVSPYYPAVIEYPNGYRDIAIAYYYLHNLDLEYDNEDDNNNLMSCAKLAVATLKALEGIRWFTELDEIKITNLKELVKLLES